MSEQRTFKSLCDENGVNYANAESFRLRHPKISDMQVIEYYLKKRESQKPFRTLCRELGVNYSRAYWLKSTYGLSDDLAIKYAQKPRKSLRAICAEHGISYVAMMGYRRNHPDISDDDLIELYKQKVEKAKQKLEKEQQG